MNVRLSIGLQGRQSIAIAPQVIQSIRLLQFGHDELQDFLAEQAERNPLIAVTTDRPKEAARPAPAPTGGGRREAAGEGEGERSFEDYCAAQVSLREHLHDQAGMTFRDPVERLIAVELIEAIDADGYLRRDLDEIADRLGTAEARVEAVLARVQGFDPVGVAARDLAECLALQLRERNRLDPAMAAMLTRLDLLASYDLRQLTRVCGVDMEDIGAMAREIRSLDPRPGRRFDCDPVLPALPDILVTSGPDGSHAVELNPALLPRVLINRQYYATITANRLGAQDKRFVMDCMASARWLARNLDQRARTILKVATEIVARQADFFRHGVDHMRPLSLRDVAEVVGIHESTVCRAISNKFMLTDRGLFELKYFFSNSIAATDGGDSHCSETVRHRIAALVALEEADTVLSDDAIAAELRKAGIDIARRTIAKYRDMLNIPSSLRRRRQKQVEAFA